MNKNSGFNLLWVILIIIMTAFVTSIATGVIMLNNTSTHLNNNTYINNDQELKEFIDVYETLLSKYYDKIDKAGMLNAAEEAMVKYLGDKYTTYLDDEKYQEIIDELSGEYNRIGLVIQNNVVIKVMPLSSAYKAGIKNGDIIKSIDNTDVEELNGNDITKLIKNSNNELSIQVKRGNEYLNFVLEKDKYPSISYEVLDDTYIGYVYIKSFSQNLSEQMSLVLNELEAKGIKSLIIDVRDNVGGYLSAAEETLSLFLEKGKILYSLQTNTSNFTYNDETNEKRDYPIVVLINRGSASASEILAAALKESYGATLVGNQSYGKGKVQQMVSLSSGDSVKYTSAKWLTPSGICIDGIGIAPSYNVLYEDGEKYDTQILKAIELLQ